MNNEDLSNIINKFNNSNNPNNISPEMIDNLMNMINNSNNSNSNKSSNQNINSKNSSDNINNSNDIDIETILKMKNIIDKMNLKDDPRSNLLKSLKPYLNENRKSKIDQYIQLINMSKVMDVFPFMGGDKKNNG